MEQLGLVALGGGIGAACRHLVGLAALRHFGPAFPFGTLIVNVSGGLLMGLIAGAVSARAAGGAWPLFLTTGVLGGFTTFSAFSLETVLLWERGEAGLALGYCLGSVILSIAALAGGLAVSRSLA